MVSILSKIFKESLENAIKIPNESKETRSENMNNAKNKITNWIELVNKLIYTSKDENNLEKLRITDYILNETKDLSLPNKMDLFKGLDITEKDNVFLLINSTKRYYNTALFVNGEDHVIGTFITKNYLENGEKNTILQQIQSILILRIIKVQNIILFLLRITLLIYIKYQ